MFPDLPNFVKFDPFSTMINSFISLVVKDILKSGTDLKDLAVVFPNLRAGAIFRKELAAAISLPAWSPGVFSIDDWLVQLSGLQQVDKLVALTALYPIVQKQMPYIQSFGDFLDLGETILADFDDVDKYLANPVSVFTTLLETKRIDSRFDISEDEELAERLSLFWRSFGDLRSPHQEKWLELWEKLLPVYTEFEQVLLSRGTGTSGMCYRKAAADLRSGKANSARYKKIAFAGFNILTAAEEDVFEFLMQQGAALFYWDFHPSYLETPNEAGKFIRPYLKKFPPQLRFEPFEGQEDCLFGKNGNTEIFVFPVTSNTGQVQALLNELKIRPERDRGIILSDEGLFSDLLASWPDELPVNFSSGYPLKDTKAGGFFRSLIEINNDFHRHEGVGIVDTALLLDFLNHPWSNWFTGSTSDSLVQTIRRRFPESVPADFFTVESMLGEVAGPAPVSEFLRRIRAICTSLLERRSDYYKIEQAAIESVSDQANIYLDLIDRRGLKLDPKSLTRLFQRFNGNAKISLETDREACNQVTGVLETRLVDYEEVFILSFNEGIWPSKQLPGSLIPYSLRKMFGLPTAESRDAMYAYYFYRLIQRTRSLNIYYLTGHRDDSIRSGEQSRYLTQLQYGMGKRPVIRSEPPSGSGRMVPELVVAKSPEVMARLNRFVEGVPDGKALSPSAINEYLDCSLRFALNRIMGLKQPEVVQNAADPRGLGTLLHRVMNRLYNHFAETGTGPAEAWLKEAIGGREQLTEIILEEYHRFLKEPGNIMPGGKELLGLEVVKQFVSGILEFDKKNKPLKIIALEQEFSMGFPVETAGRQVKIRLHGFIDRVDLMPDGVRIIDYKTGQAELKANDISDLFDRAKSKRPKEAFQVLLYCEFYRESTHTGDAVFPCLFRLGQFRSGNWDHRIRIGGSEVESSAVSEDFRKGLIGVLEELFNPDVPFVKCNDEQHCRFCPYAGLCSRED